MGCGKSIQWGKQSKEQVSKWFEGCGEKIYKWLKRKEREKEKKEKRNRENVRCMFVKKRENE